MQSIKWKRWTKEEIAGINRDIQSLPLLEVAAKYGRQPSSIVRLIKHNQMLPAAIVDSYCFGISPDEIVPNDKGNGYERWTEDEDACLMELFQKGESLPMIASSHQRTLGAIVSRLARLTGKERDEIRKTFFERSGL